MLKDTSKISLKLRKKQSQEPLHDPICKYYVKIAKFVWEIEKV